MSRNLSLDAAKLFMALMVIGLHGGFLKETTQIGWYLTTNGLFRIAVPTFLVINGYYFQLTLENKSQRAWFYRVSVLYFCWMAIYSYFWITTSLASAHPAIDLVRNLLIGYHHLWYLPGMLGAALTLVLIHKSRSETVLFLSAATLIAGTFIQYAGNYRILAAPEISQLLNSHWTHRNFLFFAFPFFAAGYIIRKHSIDQMLSAKQATILSIAGLALVLTESAANFYLTDGSAGFDNYLSLGLACPAIFIALIKHHRNSDNKSLALYSSAIYFTHSLCLSILRKTTKLDPTPLTAAAILASFACAYVVVRIYQRHRILL